MKNILKYFILVFLATLFTGVFFILPDFLDNPFNGLKGFFTLFFQWGIICIVSFFLIYSIAANKYLFSILFPVYCFIGSIIAYFRYAYKVSLTPMIIDATLHNDTRTSLDLISFELILFVVISVAISIVFVIYRFKEINLSKSYLHIIPSLFLFVVLLNSSHRLQNSLANRFPLNVYYNVKAYHELNNEKIKEKINPDTLFMCENRTDSLIVAFVIGESLRADHLSLNEYERETNPLLSKRTNIFSLSHIYTEYSYTNRSIPHILTRADSIYIERAFNEMSFIPFFNKCGFYSSWISNQDAAHTYVSFMNECDTLIYAHPEKSTYNYNLWLDEDLLPIFDDLLSKNYPRQLFILHTIGSHWFYNSHFSDPYKIFEPICSSRIITQCTAEEIINSYDNTVVYTDFFLDNLIQRLENKNAVLIYLSDHGEVLGEDGQWLHASGNEASKYPASIVWMSEKYKNNFPEKVTSLEENQKKYYRTDFLYPSILSAGDIHSEIIDRSLDIFTIQ